MAVPIGPHRRSQSSEASTDAGKTWEANSVKRINVNRLEGGFIADAFSYRMARWTEALRHYSTPWIHRVNILNALLYHHESPIPFWTGQNRFLVCKGTKRQNGLLTANAAS